MKKQFSKFLSGLLASAFIIFTLPFTAFGDYEVDGMSYRFGNGGVILTDCLNTSAEKITIPEKALINNLNFKVIGVDDYAFGYCNDLSVVHVPSSLKLDSMGNVAFLTASSIINFINAELGEGATFEDVVKYIAKEINYNNGNYTDDDMNIISQIIMDKVNKIDTSASPTLEGKVMTLIKNIDQMGLSNKTLDKFNLWISNVRYTDMTIKGEDDTEIQTYVTGRESLGLKYEVTLISSDEETGTEFYYSPIDTDNDGVNDGIQITGYSGNIQKVEIPEKIDKLPVVSISGNAFTEAQMLNTVTIPKNVNNIGEKALGYFQDGTPISDFTIIGYSDTASERYALKNGITFIDITSLPKLSMTEIELDVGEMLGISVQNYSGDITWVSSDTTIATVNDGYIHAVSGGEVTIYAMAGNTTLECKVTVIAPPVYSTITVSSTSTTKSIEPPISLTSKITTASVTTTLEPAISLTSKITTASVTTTLEPAISLTSKQTTATTTIEPAISLTSKTTVSSSVTSSQTISIIATTSQITPVTTSETTTASMTTTSQTTASTTTSMTTTSQTITSTTTSITTTSQTITSITTGMTTTSQTITSATTSMTTTSQTITSATTGMTTTSLTTTSITTSMTTTSLTTTSITTSITTTSLTTTSTTTSITATILTTTSVTTSMTTTSYTTTSTTTSMTNTSEITTITTTVTTYETRIVYIGDANEDGKVNVRDAAYIAKMLAIEQVYRLPFLADFNQDEKINVRDSAALSKVLATTAPKQWTEVIIRIYPI